MNPKLEAVVQAAEEGKYSRMPVSTELYADSYTPVEVMRMLQAASHHCFLLESAENNQNWGRYTFLGYDPEMEITCIDGAMRVRTKGKKTIHETVKHPGSTIREILKAYRTRPVPGMPPFTGGLVGYFSYEYITYVEPILAGNGKENGEFCDVDLMLFNKVIVFDHYRQKIILITGVNLREPEKSYKEAMEILKEMEALLNAGKKAIKPPLRLKGELKPLYPKDMYIRMVETAKEHIREGDIFQVVLSDPMLAKADGSLFDTYRVLRTLNPSPYMFYFSSDDVEIAGASPETLVKLEQGRLYTFPLAGTRPRGKTKEEDRQLEEELKTDEKERAEHNMLVDLGRNDVGKISRVGSVNVEQYMQVEKYSHVMHLGSTVSGEILPDKDALDAVDAILPAGTLSGAPKIRACEIIKSLENRKRGIYGGAVGYLDFSGNMDLCIGIRLAYKKNGMVCVQSGAGIVADSVPEKEFTECVNKAKAVVTAIHMAEGGLE